MGNCCQKCFPKKKKKPIEDKLLSKEEEGETKENITEQNESNLKKEYEESLGRFRVTEGAIKNHHYMKSQGSGGNKTINKPKQLRITKEIKQMSKQLPIYYTNSIFLLYDPGNIDIMQALIIGSHDTPYANGIFLFDIELPDTYPNTPPKMNLMTTGNGTVRFNPNLYQTGFVCLSLLGTWTGATIENWNPTSSILQVLLSIQSLVMNEDVFYNEPGTSKFPLNQKYQMLNHGYSNIVKYCTVKYAMTEIIKKPPEGFQDIVRTHFRLKKEAILRQVYQWLSEAEKDKMKGCYEGIVLSHNTILATKFNTEGTYFSFLRTAVTELEEYLNSKLIDLV